MCQTRSGAHVRLSSKMLSVVFSLSFFAASGLASELPKVDIVYPPGGSLLDRFCKSDLGMAVDQAKIQEAVQRRGQFQEQWNIEGPSYMNTALTEIGLEFPYREVQATLTVCLPASTSVPLVVDVKPFLHSAAKSDPAWEFSEIVFHELMHLYVSPVFRTSVLTQKYRNEPPTTKYHLHVMAVEKLVLLKLNRADQLKVIDHDYRSGPDPAYKRAWEIVNDIENYQRFIDELRALKG